MNTLLIAFVLFVGMPFVLSLLLYIIAAHNNRDNSNYQTPGVLNRENDNYTGQGYLPSINRSHKR